LSGGEKHTFSLGTVLAWKVTKYHFNNAGKILANGTKINVGYFNG